MRHLMVKQGLCVLMALILIGCSANSKPVDTSETEEKIVVLWHKFTGPEGYALQTLGDRFNAENPWNIVLITEYQQDILDKLTAIDPQHRPDLVVLWPEDISAYVQSGLAADSDLLTTHLRAARSDLLPMAEALYTLNNELWAVPLGLATYLLYYNADWLGDLGYNAEVANWEFLRRSACAASDPLHGQVGLGMPSQAGVLLALLASGGSTLLGEDGHYHFADAAGIERVEQLQELLSSTCGLVYETYDAGIPSLSNSSMAMLIESSLHLAEIEHSVEGARNFALEVGALPGPEGPGQTLWYGPALMAVATEPERQETALQVMTWFFSTDAQNAWSSATNYLPVRRSLIETRQATTESIAQKALLHITLESADSGTWVIWPRRTKTPACRGALLRSLLALKDVNTVPNVSLTNALNACNTEVQK